MAVGRHVAPATRFAILSMTASKKVISSPVILKLQPFTAFHATFCDHAVILSNSRFYRSFIHEVDNEKSIYLHITLFACFDFLCCYCILTRDKV
jgi:hypothetical protein